MWREREMREEKKKKREEWGGCGGGGGGGGRREGGCSFDCVREDTATDSEREPAVRRER